MMQKEAGKENPADALTKYLHNHFVVELCDKVGKVRRSGRAGAQMEVQGTNPMQKPTT